MEMNTITVGPKQIGYKCKLCHYYTSLELLIHNHIGDHQAGTGFNCGSFIIDKFSCLECEFTTDFTVLYTRHMVKCHVMMELESEDDVNSYICSNCSFQTHFILKWVKHVNGCFIKQVKIEEWFQCDQCDCKYRDKGGLERHKSEEHPGSFDCGQSNNEIKTDLVLNHVTNNVKEFKCDRCDYVTKTEFYLEKHKKGHGVVTEQDTMLKKKRKRYLRDPKTNLIHCNECDYKAKRTTHFRNHLLNKHLGEFLKCDQCDYKSKLQKRMEYHKKTHELECDQCDYKGKTKSWLNLHKKTYHRKSEIKLPKCDQPKVNKHWADLDVIEREEVEIIGELGGFVDLT